VSTKMSLELISHDGVIIRMGVAVRLPPVGCRSILLGTSKWAFSRSVHWAITSFFSTPLSQSMDHIGSLAYEKVVG
jgi:hypothetical protein